MSKFWYKEENLDSKIGSLRLLMFLLKKKKSIGRSRSVVPKDHDIEIKEAMISPEEVQCRYFRLTKEVIENSI